MPDTIKGLRKELARAKEVVGALEKAVDTARSWVYKLEDKIHDLAKTKE